MYRDHIGLHLDIRSDYLTSSLVLRGIATLSTITTGPPPHSTSTLSPKSPPSPGTYRIKGLIVHAPHSLLRFACICKVSRGVSVSSSMLISFGSAVYGLPPTRDTHTLLTLGAACYYYCTYLCQWLVVESQQLPVVVEQYSLRTHLSSIQMLQTKLINHF